MAVRSSADAHHLVRNVVHFVLDLVVRYFCSDCQCFVVDSNDSLDFVCSSIKALDRVLVSRMVVD